MIKNLIYDFGKVLVDYDFKKLIASVIKDPREIEEFYGIFCSLEFCNLCDKGDVPYEEIIREYRSRYPRWDKALDEFGRRQADMITGEMPGMHELLASLKERGYRLYGLTNWSSVVYTVMSRYSIFSLLDGRIISSEEHLIKPDAAIYHRLCEKYSLSMDECLFTDDKQLNVDGAVAAGMDAVLFCGTEGYRQELQRRGIL